MSKDKNGVQYVEITEPYTEVLICYGTNEYKPCSHFPCGGKFQCFELDDSASRSYHTARKETK